HLVQLLLNDFLGPAAVEVGRLTQRRPHGLEQLAEQGLPDERRELLFQFAVACLLRRLRGGSTRHGPAAKQRGKLALSGRRGSLGRDLLLGSSQQAAGAGTLDRVHSGVPWDRSLAGVINRQL